MTPDAVITGCGVAAPNGLGREAFGAALRSGRSGLGDLVSFDASDLGRERAGEITSFDATPWLRAPKNYLDRNSALAFAAAEMAVRESGIVWPCLDRGHGVSVGTMAGNMESLSAFCARVAEKGPKLAPPFLFPHAYYNTTAGLLSIEYGLSGPHGQFCSGGAAGLEAVLFAAEAVRRGRAEAMLAGGVEAFHEKTFRLAVARGWVSPSGGGAESCRPFGAGRNGTIVGEGAAFFVIESEAAARARGARVLARIAATATAATAGEVYAAVLRQGDAPEAVFAAAAGSREADAVEGEAIRAAVGATTPVTAIKGWIGETFGASGPLALAAALAGLEGGFLPPCVPGECAIEGLQLVKDGWSGNPNSALVAAGGPGSGTWCAVILRR